MDCKMRIDDSNNASNHDADEFFSEVSDRIKKQEEELCRSSSNVMAGRSTAAGHRSSSNFSTCSSITDSCSDSETSNDIMNEIAQINQRAFYWGDNFSDLILAGKETVCGMAVVGNCTILTCAGKHNLPRMMTGATSSEPLESPLWAEAKQLLEHMNKEQDEEFSMGTTNTRTTIPPSSSVDHHEDGGDQQQEEFVDDLHHQSTADNRRLLFFPIQDQTSFEEGGHAVTASSELDSESIGDGGSTADTMSVGSTPSSSDRDFAIFAVG